MCAIVNISGFCSEDSLARYLLNIALLALQLNITLKKYENLAPRYLYFFLYVIIL